MTEKGKKQIVHAELIFCVQLFAALMLMFSLFRLLFLLIYSSEFTEVPAAEILRGLVHGLRFDAAVTAWVLGAVLLLSHLPFINRFRLFRWLWIILAHVAVIVLSLLVFSDLQYFQHARKRLGYEAFAYLDTTILPIAKTAVAEKPHYFLFAAAALIGFWLLSRYNVRRLRLAEYHPIAVGRYLFVYIICIPLVVVMARGGLQRVPLRVADSFISRFNSVNTLTVNSPHMAFRSLAKSWRVQLMESERAERISLELLGLDGTRQSRTQYPLLVQVQGFSADSLRKYNVVIILMESFTAKYTAAGGDSLGVTPNFNALARDGLLFDRFFATGFRSTSGLFSVLTGIPDQPGVPVMRRQELQDSFGSLSVLLKVQGYRNIFVHGGLLDFDNLENMLMHEQFDVIIGKEAMKGCGGPERTWGYDDEFMFKRAHQEFVKYGNQPFFGYIFTVSNHAPYDLPDQSHYVFGPGDHKEYRFLNGLRYSDWALGEFFALASKADYFENTIFIITADHTHHTNLNLYENQNIPLLIYAPGIVSPGIRSTVAAQTDILPTVAALLGLPYHATMGRDLLSLPEEAGFAFWISGQGIGWVEGDYIAVMGLDDRLPIVYDYTVADFATNVSEIDTTLGRAIRVKANAIYQFSSDLLAADRIFPRRLAQPFSSD